MEPQTFYEVLGVSHDCSSQDLREKYVSLARRLHPDKCRGVYEKEFAMLQSAWETLSDPTKRSRYDVLLQTTTNSFLPPPSDRTVIPDSSFWDAISLQDMNFTDGFYTHSCRCGDFYEISAEDQASGASILTPCGGCTLKILVSNTLDKDEETKN